MTETPPCPLCGGTSRAPWLTSADPVGGEPFAVVRCRRCATRYTCPRPAESAIADYYPADYAPHKAAESRGDAGGRWFGRLRGKAVERRAVPLRGGGRLLDVGCGGGGFLARMAKRGWTVTGLDFSPAVVKTIRERFGFKAVLGSLPCPDLEPASFDVVTMWMVLEHFHRPLEALTAARRLLAPGGRLYAAVPNADALSAKWYGEDWQGLELPRHLTHFDAGSLRGMMEKAGLRVASVKTVRHAGWCRLSAAIARRRGRLGGWKAFAGGKFGSKAASLLAFYAGRGDALLAAADPAEATLTLRAAA